MSLSTPRNWLDALTDEDLAFIKRFVLASGSLKETASTYGVSYPTVRLRLDRVIQKIRLAESEPDLGMFERVLRSQFGDGKIDREIFLSLRNAYRAEKEQHDDHKAPSRPG